ncbi:MAG: enoyl-CoA hydratase/isomerase family protein [Spirochaetes bacterium]|nr:enoyl-CoA hydratase/isomerase family protein [Spirochaetota bacterium]MBU1079380.1 enoyl-CoA hydratase/isomerase family protein [Spirochaetota bacterium]
MAFENFVVVVEERIALVTINRPQALNALSRAVLEELDEALDQIESSSGVDAVILTGEGKAFVAGADIAEMRGMSAEEGRAFGVLGSRVFRRIERFRIPVIAAVNGFALGGGCELAMACDIRIASDKAKFGQPEVGLGIIPGFSGTQRLPRIVGASKAKELIFTGDMIKADEALAIGLVSKVVPPEELLPACRALAAKIGKNASGAVAYAKAAVNRGLETDIETGMELEQNLFGLCFASADQKEGMGAFIEKRPASFVGK